MHNEHNSRRSRAPRGVLKRGRHLDGEELVATMPTNPAARRLGNVSLCLGRQPLQQQGALHVQPSSPFYSSGGSNDAVRVLSIATVSSEFPDRQCAYPSVVVDTDGTVSHRGMVGLSYSADTRELNCIPA